MLILVDSPAVQEVPAASCMTTDQVPLAHCWYEVPPMQFHSPSVVQAVPAAMAEPAPVVPVLPVLAAVDEDATGVEALALETADATGVEEATGAEVALDAPADDATVAKTPPVATGDEEATTAAEVALEAAAVVALDAAAEVAPAVAVAPPETALPQPVPVGVARAAEVAVPSCSTESPGFGKRRSVES